MSNLTFTSQGNTSIQLCKFGSPNSITLNYKTSSVNNWTAYKFSAGGKGEIINLSDGDILTLSGATSTFSKDKTNYYSFITDGDNDAGLIIEGDIMSLINNKATLPGPFTFCNLFSNCKCITKAEGLVLPATILTVGCYASMFYNCKNLETIPTLPATTLAEKCYQSMFEKCVSI